MDVSRETSARFAIYLKLLRQWNRKINLVGRSTLPDAENRHISEGIAAYNAAGAEWTSWCDLGSGGGIPGIAVSIMKPDRTVVLIEADQRKAAFLRTVIRETGVSAVVHAKRIEDVPTLSTDIVSARALAPLPQLLDFVHRHMGPNAIAILPKGKTVETELSEARKLWQFSVEKVYNNQNPDSVILKIGDLSRAG